MSFAFFCFSTTPFSTPLPRRYHEPDVSYAGLEHDDKNKRQVLAKRQPSSLLRVHRFSSILPLSEVDDSGTHELYAVDDTGE